MTPDGLKTVSYKTGHTGRRALLCILLGAAIVAGSLLLQQRLGVPSPFKISAGEKAEQQDSAARQTRQLALSTHTVYALQLGAFTQEEAARQLAQEFAGRGAAGYVHFDGDAYRVLAAAYPTRAEAQAVQTRLGGQNISTYIHPCTQDALTLRAGGEKRQVEAVAEALSYLDGLGGKLHTLSAALDSRDRTAEECRSALLSEGVTCAGLRQNLSDAFDGDVPAALQSLGDIFSQVSDIAEAARNENSAARVGAALKKAQLTVFFGLDSFVRALQP